jgi:peptide deformylase
MVVVNPVIMDHTKSPIFKREGCMSFPDNDIKEMILRYNKVVVTYQTLAKINEESEPTLSKPISENLNGGLAHIFQHELSHLNGVNIYDNGYGPQSSVGFGDGLPIDPHLWDDKVEEIKTKKE